MSTSIIQRIAKTTDCNHYSVIGARIGSVVSLVAFGALAILWGNLGDISEAVHTGLGIGALGAITLVAGFETLASYWQRGEISRLVRTIKHENGDSYSGETLSTGESDGAGVYTFANGNKLKGQFKNGEYIGDDVLHLPNESSYAGVFENGIPHGAGVLTLPNQNCLDGVFERGTISHGTLVYNAHPRYRSYSGPIIEDALGIFTPHNGNPYEDRLHLSHLKDFFSLVD